MLVNYKKPAPAQTVDPERFLQIYMRHATCEATDRAIDIISAYIARKPNAAARLSWNLNIYDNDVFDIVGAIYEAGRIQGKREERKKKRV